MNERKNYQSSMEEALKHQDRLSEILRDPKSHPIAIEYAEVGIALNKHDPNKSGYPNDRNMI